MVALFVALTFVGFVLVDFVVQRMRAPRAATLTVAAIPWNVAKGFYLAEDHSWSYPDSSLGMKVGTDALVAHALGSVDKVVLPKIGDLVKAGEPLFLLENHGKELRIPSSITGQVVALNPRLSKHPELVAKDPYGSGWVCAIAPTQSAGSPGCMRCGEKAAAWLELEFHRFREFLSLQVSPDPVLSVSYPDGGLPAEGSLNHLGRDAWSAFEAEFLSAEGSRQTP